VQHEFGHFGFSSLAAVLGDAYKSALRATVPLSEAPNGCIPVSRDGKIPMIFSRAGG